MSLGLSGDSLGKILTQFPRILTYRVEDNLRLIAEYFKSLGVDVAIVLHKSPGNLGLSIEGHLKPVTKFFWERGFSVEEVRTKRIRPRYALVKELGVKKGLNRMLALSRCDFEKVLQMYRKNVLA
ncbi:hypothetical protein Pint_26833 [Pistacia integerrima]|uniref:Uncharacterized protein n=1 Tax=Pistacia integerrima TaxID=434235 RepID=A0ACC0YSH3_9ROSI|nr:hypothetical protein Pint_26833 [Pistacia integerrima]